MRVSRQIFFSLVFVFSLAYQAYAQVDPPSGPYTSSDGMYTVNVQYSDTLIVVTEPNHTSYYKLVPDNVFLYVNPKNGKEYKLKVEDQTTLLAFTAYGSTHFYFSGGLDTMTDSKQFSFYQEVAEEYKKKMRDEPHNTQLWSFCAAAAMNRATLNETGFEEYARAVILSMRQIVEDQMKCPCPRAIPPSLWASTR